MKTKLLFFPLALNCAYGVYVLNLISKSKYACTY